MDYNNGDNSNLDNNSYDNDFNNNNNFNNGSNNDLNNNNNFNNGYPNYNSNFNNNFNNNYNNNENPNNGSAIASLILGILSIPLSCCYGLGAILAIIGIVFGITSKKYNGNKISGMAMAGIICSILGLISSIFMIIYVVYIFSQIDVGQFDELFRSFQDMENNQKFY